MPLEQRHVALDGSTTVSNGPWIPVDSLFSIIFTGMVSGDVLQVWVSNTPVKPAGASLQNIRSIQMATDITANGSFVMGDKVVWVQVRMSANAGGGTVYADLFAYESAGA